MHEHIKKTHSNLWPWFKGFFVSALFVGGAVGAVLQKKLPDPRQQLPEKVTCEGAARVSVIATLVVSLLAMLLPWIAPHGSVPFVLSVCCACSLLLRDPRVVVGTSGESPLCIVYTFRRLIDLSLSLSHSYIHAGD